MNYDDTNSKVFIYKCDLAKHFISFEVFRLHLTRKALTNSKYDLNF